MLLSSPVSVAEGWRVVAVVVAGWAVVAVAQRVVPPVPVRAVVGVVAGRAVVGVVVAVGRAVMAAVDACTPPISMPSEPAPGDGGQGEVEDGDGDGLAKLFRGALLSQSQPISMRRLMKVGGAGWMGG